MKEILKLVASTTTLFILANQTTRMCGSAFILLTFQLILKRWEYPSIIFNETTGEEGARKTVEKKVEGHNLPAGRAFFYFFFFSVPLIF